MPDDQITATQASNDFSNQAEQQSVGIISEFVAFLVHNKKWWMTPILIVLLLLGILIVLAGTSLAPFIYPGI